MWACNVVRDQVLSSSKAMYSSSITLDHWGLDKSSLNGIGSMTVINALGLEWHVLTLVSIRWVLWIETPCIVGTCSPIGTSCTWKKVMKFTTDIFGESSLEEASSTRDMFMSTKWWELNGDKDTSLEMSPETNLSLGPTITSLLFIGKPESNFDVFGGENLGRPTVYVRSMGRLEFVRCKLFVPIGKRAE